MKRKPVQEVSKQKLPPDEDLRPPDGDLRQGKRPTIAFLSGSPGSIFIYEKQQMWSGIVQAAREHGANLLYVAGESFEYRPTAVLYELLDEQRVDGLISWDSFVSNQSTVERTREFFMRHSPLPVVSIERAVEGFCSLLADNTQGTRDLVTHLIEVHGYRRIAFLDIGVSSSALRLRAFKSLMTEYGFYNPHLVGASLGEFEARGLRPGVDYEAVVAPADDEAVSLIEAFRSRGMWVPDDVAVTGFNDGQQARTATPPLTTVRLPFYEMGRRATEMVLDLIAGEEAPEQTFMPLELVVRQSCGCASPAVVAAAAGVRSVADPRQGVVDPRQGMEKSLETALAARQERILADVAQAVGISAEGLKPGWAEQLLDGFVSDVASSSAGLFLSALDKTLRQVVATNGDVVAWHGAVSALRRHLLPHLEGEALSLAEDLWQQARVMIGETALRVQVYHSLQAEQQAQVLREVGTSLNAAYDVRELVDVLAEGLSRLGIPSCYLALFQDPQPYAYPQPAPEWSRLVLAYDENSPVVDPRQGVVDPRQGIELEGGGQRFRSRHLVPDGVLPQDRLPTGSTVVEPLYVGENQLGFVLLGMGPRDGTVYEVLRGQLSGALQGALLFTEREQLLADLEGQSTRYQNLYNQAPNGYFSIGPDRMFVEANDTWLRWVGYTREELVGKMGPSDLLTPDSRSIFQRNFSLLIKQGTLTDVSVEWQRKDGSTFVTSVDATALYDERGSFVRSRVTAHDITERERLLTDLERRSIQLQAATEVSRAASSILDPDELIQQAVELICARFSLYYVGLFLVDQTGQWAVLRAGTGEPGRQMVERGHKLEVGGDSMIGQCVALGQARIALDVGGEARRFDNPLLPDTRSEMALPLVSRGQVVGAVTIQSELEAAFSDEDIATLRTMADQLAVAFDNARLFEETRARAEELAVLNEMSRALPIVLDVDTVIESTYRYASRLMDTTNFYVALYDAQRDEVSFPFYAEGEQIRRAGSRPAGKGMTEHVIRAREPLLIEENVDGQLEKLGIESIGQEAQSWLGVPMMVGDRVIGVVAVQSYTTPRVYDEHHRDLLSAIASQAAVVIENARLFEETRVRAERERLVRTITERVRRATDREAIMRVALEELGQVLGAAKSVARLGTRQQLLSE